MQNHSYTLTILWLNDSLGIALSKKNVKMSSIPLTNFYFWPRNNAWEQLGSEIDLRPWITITEKIKLLNEVSNVINCWQKCRHKTNLISLQDQFSQHQVVGRS